MYEKFTDRARKVMQLANEEAQRYSHSYIGSEHILLSLAKEGIGVAAIVLKKLDIHESKIRREVERIIETEPHIDKKLYQVPRAKRVIEYAIEEARNLKHNYVGTEHVLLGLLREEQGVAAQVLINLGMSLTDVRREVLELLGRHPVMSSVQSQSPPESLHDLPTSIGSAVAALDELVYVLQEMKENAIGRHDFEWAASLRDQEHNLRKMRAWLLANKDREQTRPSGQDPA